MSIRIVVVDDQEMVRSGFTMILASEPDFDIVGEASDGAEALALLANIAADVVIMDVRMPRMNGVEATRALRRQASPPEVLILTTFDLDEYAFDAIQAGASGFLLKDAPSTELAAAIRHVAAGDAVVAPSTTRRLLEHVNPPRRAPATLERLTAREREVLVHIARGLSNAEIADTLYLSPGTVKVHVGHILDKLELRNRVQAVVLAYEAGIVSPGSTP